MKPPRATPAAYAALGAAAILVLSFAPAQYFGRQQDDLLYLIGAQGLLSGRYCLSTAPGCPPLGVTPGWPALLAPLAALTERPAAFQAFSALLLAGVPVALWAWLRRRFGEAESLLAAALFASSPIVLSQSGVVMSEAPYALALIALLARAESGRAAAAGGWAALLVLLRPAGLAALPAAAAFRRRPRELALALGPALLAAGGWAAWSMTRAGRLDDADELFMGFSGGDWARPLELAARGAAFFAESWGGSHLPPGAALAPALGALLLAGAAFGAARALERRGDEPAAWALLGAAALHALWSFQYERYLIALLPLLLWALLEALGRRAVPALATLLALQLGTQTLPRLGRPGPWSRPELERSYAWLAAQPGPALLASAQPVRDGYLAGLPGVPLPDARSPGEFAAALKTRRVRWVLRAEGDYGLPPDAPLMRRLARAYRHLEDRALFRLAHEEPAERAAIYEPL